MLTNSESNKPGPKEVHAGNIYTFAHQPYWGFRFLSERRKSIWRELLAAKTIKHIQDIGRACSQRHAMKGAGYGAKGLMTWLKSKNVARQVLAAQRHRRYPRSERPSSLDKQMIFLGIAVAAGVSGNEFSTALRKLAQAGLGEKHLNREVHNWDRVEKMMKEEDSVWAEPIFNYCDPTPEGDWRLKENLPCPVPKDRYYHDGYIIHGFLPDGRVASKFSRTLPTELCDVANAKKEKAKKRKSNQQKSVK